MIQINFIYVLTVVLLVRGDPICQEYEKEIVCRPGSSDYRLKRGLVSDNENLTSIILSSCRIIDIDIEAFENLPKLDRLDLSLNKIQNLQLGVFDEFREVKSLNLSFNQLTGFPLDLFEHKTKLLYLDLKGNRINELQLGILDPMTRLMYLDLSNNALSGANINAHVFDKSADIREMFLSGNDMTGADNNLLSGFNKLGYLDLDKCFLTDIPKFAVAENLKTMKYLKLSNNKITKLIDVTTFEHLKSLKTLNLANNAIESIIENIFTPLVKLNAVILSGNNLSQLADTLFQYLPNLSDIDLSRNLIEYVPVSAFKGTPVKILNLADNRFTFLDEDFSLELNYSGGMLRKFYFNKNPWQCSCLRKTIAEVKSANIEYDNMDFNGKEPVCVSGERFGCQRNADANTEFIKMYYQVISRKNEK